MRVVLDWHESQWPKPNQDRKQREQRILGKKEQGKLPCTLIALDAETLLGFVSLIHHEASQEKGRPYWIDAVYVETSQRKKGIASSLIQAAEKRARHMKLEKLFALTEIPKLYQKNGWSIAEKIDPIDYVMNKNLI